MSEVYFDPGMVRKRSIDDILYDSYSTGRWNPDFESISPQRRLKFMNRVVRDVIKNPNIAQNDPTYEKIFNNCIKNVRKQCKLPPEQIDPFCRIYTTKVLGLNEKYIPRVKAVLFGEESSHNCGNSCNCATVTNPVTYTDNSKVARAVLYQETVRPNTEVMDRIRQNASCDIYRQTG